MEGLRCRIQTRKKEVPACAEASNSDAPLSYKPLVALKKEKVRRKTSDLRFRWWPVQDLNL